MSRESSAAPRNPLWSAITAVTALAALACGVVAFGVGWRAWILVGGQFGIIAHVDAAGQQAAPWGIVGAILLLTAVVAAIAGASFRRLAAVTPVAGAAASADPVDEDAAVTTDD